MMKNEVKQNAGTVCMKSFRPASVKVFCNKHNDVYISWMFGDRVFCV